MPIPDELRDVLEDDLENNLSKVTVFYPPNHDEPLSIDTIYLRMNSWTDDPLRVQQETKPVVVISYPNQDVKFSNRLMGDFGRDNKFPVLNIKRSDEVVNSYTTVIGVTEVIFNITITEYNMKYLEIYTDIPSGSTSRLICEIWDKETEKRLARSYLYNSSIGRNGWTKIPIEIGWLNPEHQLRIVLKEFGSYGDNPIGIKIGKNVASEYLIRFYSFDIQTMKSVWYSAIMRLSIFGKDKLVEATPSGGYLAKERVANGISKAIHDRIRKSWTTLDRRIKFIDIANSTEMSGFMDSEFHVTEQIDVRLSYLSSIPYETFKVIKKIEVKQLNLL